MKWFGFMCITKRRKLGTYRRFIADHIAVLDRAGVIFRELDRDPGKSIDAEFRDMWIW